ncbi:MAG: phosphoglycerate mutase (2,3-diphosphoglycerate-independent) [Flavobacteriales bacterium]|nr:phosphoglycerate mutase (2,3-diphosphoglycerate-independent) [Flavobacteriales bacterium]
MIENKVVLLILDGWGHGQKNANNAIYTANTPFIDSLYQKYPNAELITHGESVGLPKGQMGNSEVGHINIGAGRIVDQSLARINKDCENNKILQNNNLNKILNNTKNNLHLIGLVSAGGIHSHENHLYKLCEIAKNKGIEQVFIHVFTDGRDCDPHSAIESIKNLEENSHGAKIATICGRFYAMDRDNRWERTKICYEALVNGTGEKSKNIYSSITNSYNNGISDEFIKPIIHVDRSNQPIAKICNGDSIICFNFRTDRCRQLTNVLTQNDFPKLGMKKLNLIYATMTVYDENFININAIYEKDKIKNSIGEIISKNNLKQIRIAETEKYPHVTYFFSGGNEIEFTNEKRILTASPNVTTYDKKPEMSAIEVTKKCVNEINENSTDFICVNLANPDMVGHTGNFQSIEKAVETVDKCTKEIVRNSIQNNYCILIIADHGNAEFARNKDGTPNTAHTKNPVPIFAINTKYNNIENGILADIAPTILNIMGITIPKEMTGKIILK